MKKNEVRHCEYCDREFKVALHGYRAQLCPECRKERYKAPAHSKKLAKEAKRGVK
jgi:Zn finger protein HypA/HybF involved in hydrogenase expression